MKNQLRIILYGDTLVLAGIRLSLETNPAFEVIALGAPGGAVQELPGEQELFALRPDFVIFDTSAAQPRLYYDQTGSSLQLIGVDPDRDHAMVWSGQRLVNLSVQDLSEIITHKTHANVEYLDRHHTAGGAGRRRRKPAMAEEETYATGIEEIPDQPSNHETAL